jgi:serine phosphatase RsbU (regulator of sigma subunit)
MIRRDGNILEAVKAVRIPLGVVENSNYSEENIFSLLPGFLIFLYLDRAVEPLNPQMKQFGMANTQSIQLKPEGTRKEILKEKNNAIQKLIQDISSLII